MARDERLPSRSGRMEDSAPSHRLLEGGGGSPRHEGGVQEGSCRGPGLVATSALLYALIHRSAWKVGVLGSWYPESCIEPPLSRRIASRGQCTWNLRTTEPQCLVAVDKNTEKRIMAY